MSKNNTILVRRALRVANTWLAQHQTITTVGTFLLCALLLFSRRPDTITNAQFWAEDGAVWYTDGYDVGLTQTIFRTYAGYLAVMHRLVAAGAALLPFHFAPLIFNILGLLFLLLPVILIVSKRFAAIIPYRLLAIAIAVIYVGIMNNDEIVGNLANIQWSLTLLAFLIIIAKPSQELRWRIFDGAALIAAGLSGPSVILLTPIALYVWWRTKDKQNKMQAIILGCVSFVQVAALTVISHYPRVGAQSDANMQDFVRMLVGQIFAGGLLGVKYITYYYNHHHVMYLLACIGISLVVYAAITGPRWLRLFSVYWPLLVISMLYSQRPVPGANIWHGLTNQFGGQRYWFVPIVGWVATVLWIALAAPHKIMRLVGCILVALLLVVGIGQNWRIAPLPDLHFQHYARHFEKLPKGTKYTLPINPGWQMTLYKK